ncbi:DNA alkylation repair protein [Pedobacter lusitanus]|uniref:DNA alkylation repair protein n=1 Tax=Pedobacter lusitanus TaxID=1503925 RepID=A0A0D0GR63_9SPHI|nr:DNA alkylation repair protein [Pedobacter lusitanus]KIO77006.1 DNA alkylation repair protein [Pedobacter lusitanus]
MSKPAKRKGARSTKDIPRDILEQLNSGFIETANLVEWLAVDQKFLLQNFLTQTARILYFEPVIQQITQLKKQTVNTINETIGTTILKQAAIHEDQEIFELMAQHQADLVRCWATYMIGKNTDLSILQVLDAIQPFAADQHFGVREICWMAVRQPITQNLIQSIHILSGWTTMADENIRRFSTEATRPRGVWCNHIDQLKDNPVLGLTILEPLKSDPSKYVQDSVGNWLNDASKTRPDFVIATTAKWEKESGSKETAYILKKALRTVNK